MRTLATTVLTLHGLVHFAGVAHAFGLPTYPVLTEPSSHPLGVAWGVAGILTLVAAVAVRVLPRDWWVFSAAAALVSQGVIASQWADARYGTVVNVLVLVAAAVAAHMYRIAPQHNRRSRWPWGG